MEKESKVAKFKSSLHDEPFSLTFSNGRKSVRVQLENNDDIFKLASAFRMMLLEHGIEHKIITDESDGN
jgi:hypothetical protein